jgi:hypothetical protein
MLKALWTKVNNLWDRFEGWVASILPGLKTKAVVALGFLGNTAFVLKDYLSGLPLGSYINLNTLLIANMVLFTLAFWFRGLGDRE